MNAPSTSADFSSAAHGLRNAIVNILESEAAPLHGVALDYDPRLSLLWVTFNPVRHCISGAFLATMQRLIKSIKANFGGECINKNQPIKYVAYRSASPDVFLYGADFDIFLESIRSGNPKPLLDYAYGCVELCYENHNLLGGRIPTIAVVSGATYGGGFEAVASCNVIVADRSAQFQLPEIRFSSFPGLAYSVVGRRAPLGALHELIMTAGVWSAQTAKDLGVVDVIANKDPVQATEAYVSTLVGRHAAHCGALRAMNATKNISRQELYAIIDDWINCTMEMPSHSVHFITKLREAQHAVRPAIASPVAH